MKKQFFPLLLSLLSIMAYSQSKKPTIMILPSDNWCNQRYFMTLFSNQGSTVKVPDYRKAFIEDTELPQVISKVGEVLTERGYSLKDAEQEIKNLNNRIVEDNVTLSKTSGAVLNETPLDLLKRRVKSDVIIQIWWKINREAEGNSVSFILEAFDAYTGKRIATSTGITKVSIQSVPTLLEQAIKENIKPFDEQMSSWYDDQKKNGREIILTIRCWDNWENDLETEYNGIELTDCIQEWITSKTVNGAYNLSDGSETFVQFEQVRIPLVNERGVPVDARWFANELRKYLRKAPFNITSKVVMRGLGEATLVLGEK